MNGRYLFLLAVMLLMFDACDQSSAPVSNSPSSNDPTSTAFQRRNRQCDTTLAYFNDDDDGASVDEVIPGQYIVVMNDNVSSSTIDAVADNVERGNGRHVGRRFRNSVKGFVANMTSSDATVLARDSRVRRVEPDRRIQIDPTARRGRQKHCGGANDGGGGGATPPAQATPWGVESVGGPHDGTGKRCWIIDSGIDLTNTDLNVDLTLSRNFSSGSSATDGFGHGTHVAGIIGAKNNSIGVVGVAPNATLVAVRVFDNTGSTTLSTVIAGIDYVAATATPGDVANLSFGSDVSLALDDAVTRLGNAGVKVAIAAGNSSADANLTSPAHVNGTNIYTVSAYDQSGRLATFSNYANPPIDWSAPGVDILSTGIGGGTLYMSGTSMAAPHVAGLLLLNSLQSSGVITGDRDATPDQKAHY